MGARAAQGDGALAIGLTRLAIRVDQVEEGREGSSGYAASAPQPVELDRSCGCCGVTQGEAGRQCIPHTQYTVCAAIDSAIAVLIIEYDPACLPTGAGSAGELVSAAAHGDGLVPMDRLATRSGQSGGEIIAGGDGAVVLDEIVERRDRDRSKDRGDQDRDQQFNQRKSVFVFHDLTISTF